MILSTSFTSHDWANRIIVRRKMEGLHTTRPWAFIAIDTPNNLYSNNIFKEDKLLSLTIEELPSLTSTDNINKEYSDKVTNFIKQIYDAVFPDLFKSIHVFTGICCVGLPSLVSTIRYFKSISNS